MISPEELKNKSNIDNIINLTVLNTIKTFNDNGFQSYLVGGCVRDLIMSKIPKDWDITTDASPEQILQVFPDSFYENDFGTVGIKSEIGTIECTPYRTESKYSDNRHPDKVNFSLHIEDDLKRRDFTMNSLAYNPLTNEFIDIYDGCTDIYKKTIKAIGDPVDRFNEDALRILRMIRFAAQLDFNIENETLNAAITCKEKLKKISSERVRDEFLKIIESPNPSLAFYYLSKTGILEYISKDLSICLGVKQNGCHKFDVFEHLIRSLQCAVDKNFNIYIKTAALFHDIGKPPTRQWSNEKKDYTFYGHEVVGANITEKVLNTLKFPKDFVTHVTKLVRWHMFFTDTDQITHSAVRRMISNVGKEYIWELMDLRICDRIGTGRPKENPYRLRKYKSIIEEVMMDATDVSMLKIDGNVLINKLHLKPGKIIGQILNVLLEECIDAPELNNNQYLEKRASELLKLSESELKRLHDISLKRKDLENENKIRSIKFKYGVK